MNIPPTSTHDLKALSRAGMEADHRRHRGTITALYIRLLHHALGVIEWQQENTHTPKCICVNCVAMSKSIANLLEPLKDNTDG